MELLERAVLPRMQRRELFNGQAEAACGGDAWPQRTGSCQGEAAHQKKRDPTMFTPSESQLHPVKTIFSFQGLP